MSKIFTRGANYTKVTSPCHWLTHHRVAVEMINLFLDVDETSLASTDPYVIEELHFYVSPIIVTFKGLADITPSQFKRYISWLIPLLSRSVLCQERTVRFVVMLVYETQVNPLMERMALSCE